MKKGYLRAYGAISGVVLESYLKSVALNHNIKLPKKDLSDYNELLKNNEIYDVVTWRKIQYLADIRNKCDHDKGIEPVKEELEDLINGVVTITKTIG